VHGPGVIHRHQVDPLPNVIAVAVVVVVLGAGGGDITEAAAARQRLIDGSLRTSTGPNIGA
jgi:hypothetical protein